MSKLIGRGGPGRGQGRKPLPDHLKVVRCGFLTLPAWLVNWLKSQPKPWGQVVKEALVEYYKLEEPGKE